MADKKMLWTGIIGSIVAVVCCVTPVLVISLGAVGLSAWVSGLDFVLLPTLAAFLALTGYALWKQKQTALQQMAVEQTE